MAACLLFLCGENAHGLFVTRVKRRAENLEGVLTVSMAKHRRILVIAALLLPVLVSGCALFSTPARTAVAYFNAKNRLDYAEARQYICDEDLAQMSPETGDSDGTEVSDPFGDKSPNERALFRFMTQNRVFRVVSVKTSGKASAVTLALIKPEFQDVFNVVMSDELSEKSELEVMQYLNRHKGSFGEEEIWRSVLHLKREHDGWKVFLDIKGQREKERKEAARKAALLREYADKLQIRNVEAGYYESNGTYYIKGEIKNAGTKTIRFLEVRIIGLNDKGEAVFEKDEVLVRDYLYPNDSADIFLLPEDPPTDWDQEVRIDVLSIEFR